MDTRTLERFARSARRQLHEQVAARLDRVLRTDSAELREHAAAVQKLKDEIKATSRAAVVEKVAYTWFNRFCALRFMDVNHYTALGVVSPAEGFTQPELLQEAKQGHIDDALPVDRQRVFDLLGGRLPAREPQQEAYRLLLVATCNGYHGAMPFLFEPIADYTELLMPDDLLSAGSILQAVRDALTPDACQDEEVIGWLYQFYIAEKKEAVDEKVKAGGKVATDELPAKTSLYTPDWIVRFLVENSLGRLWLLNRPQSKLAERMKYLVVSDQLSVVSAEPGQAGASQLTTDNRPLTTDHWPLTTPEDLRIADSAAGSGHMLLYAFDLLYAIYEEEGYNPPDIPRLILEKNLYGMEIDARSAALAAFALTMKAQRYDRRFLRRAETQAVRPNICVLHSVHFTAQELSGAAWLRKLGENLIDLPVRDALLHDLAAAAMLDNVGSLLRPQLTLAQIARVTAAIDEADDLFTQGFNDRVRDVLAQMAYLARKYHVAVTNPPYLGGANCNQEMKSFLSKNYNEGKSDLFASFMLRVMEITEHGGSIGLMTPFTWMFLSSHEPLRRNILEHTTITALVQPEYHAFFESAYVPICAFTMISGQMINYKGAYIRLNDFYGADIQPTKLLEAIRNPNCGWFYRTTTNDLLKLPGAPIAYWLSERIRQAFESGAGLADIAEPRKGITTADNEQYIRIWHEIDRSDFDISVKAVNGIVESEKKWFPVNKGGNFRKWYGNKKDVILWFDNGAALKKFEHSVIRNPTYYFREGMTWNDISSNKLAMRYSSGDAMFEGKGPMAFAKNPEDLRNLIAFFNSTVSSLMLSVLCPTLNFNIGDIAKTPIIAKVMLLSQTRSIAEDCISITKQDWDAYETSWDFTTLPLLRPEHRQATLAATYAHLRRHWQAMTDEMQRLEEENNRIFIDAYGLQDELTPDVPLHEITLTCNPHYRYSGQLAVDSGQLEQRLLADTMRELISYAVGCMFGRYSLDAPGLILANAGETVEDYDRIVGTRYIVSSGAADSPLTVADPQDFAQGEADPRFEGGTRHIVSSGAADSPLTVADPQDFAQGEADPRFEGGTRHIVSSGAADSPLPVADPQDFAQGEADPRFEGGTRHIVSSGAADSPLTVADPQDFAQGEADPRFEGGTRYIVSSGAADSPLTVADPQDFAQGEADPRFEGGTRYIVSSGAADSPLTVADPQDFAQGEADPRFEGGTRYIVSVPPTAAAGGAGTGEGTRYIVSVPPEGSSRPPSRFSPDRDNVIPILDGEWFADDIVDRCKRFLRVTFGEARYTENLAFVEQALGRDLRSYFLREFYDDHVRRYQKRPIYWLFSSPKGSFNALIYMHRYRPDTVSVVLNEYLRDFRSKLEGHKRHLEQVSISASATPRERTAALKEIDKLEKSIAELTAYENEVLYPLATQQVAIDLDDGVKVNYNKLGRALRRIAGVSE